MVSDESDDDNLLNWQVITTKRKKTKAINNTPKKQKQIDDGPSCSNINKFAALDNNNDDTGNNSNVNDNDPGDDEADNSTVKPPPIFINYVSNVTKMIKCISNVISSSEFNYKALYDGQVKLNIKSVDSYRKLVKYFDTNNFSYHTYQLKNERSYRFVIKGLHFSTKIEEIKADLLYKGHLVRNVVNVKSKYTKQPLPMFYVDIDPNPSNKKVFDIREINHCMVQIEPPRSTTDIVQCHRCQGFGHTKTYCRKPFVCVKCGLGHPTPNCPNDVETPPKCVHCLKQHTASYRGCEIYQNMLKKKLSEKRAITNHQQQFFSNQKDFPSLNSNPNQNQNNFAGKSYANVTSEGVNNNIMKNIEKLLNKQIELTNTLMNMMSLIINKLCK